MRDELPQKKMNETESTTGGHITSGAEQSDDIELPKKDRFKRDAKGRLLPGTAPGPGRPKGQTLKEYQAQRFREMTPEDKEQFLKDIAKDIKWKMAEGMPPQNVNANLSGELKVVFDSAFKEYDNSTSETEGDSSE